tara:strand:+ start:392 stop:607 length:216 start_codon:yes stop_codon:yes gene_type:complete
MTFLEFQKTNFYAWHKNWYLNGNMATKENIEGIMQGLYTLSFRDEMMKHFEENPKGYGKITATTSLPRLHR